jgi:hypothetical protein
MTDRTREPLRTVAVAALVAHIGLGVVSLLLFLAAYQFRSEWFIDPAQLVAAGSASAEFLRWGAAADLLSYYLPTGVVAYVLWRALRARSPIVADLSTLAALGYVVAGGMGAALLAVVGPTLMNEYAIAETEQATVAASFQLLTDVVYRAVWQFLDPILLAAWWLGIGTLLRVDQPRFANLSFALAAFAILGAILTLTAYTLEQVVLLGAFFVAWLAWAIWLLMLFWRARNPFHLPADT